MEDELRALQQQVSDLTNQNAALEAQLRRQQNTAQGLAELPGAITTVLNRAQAPTRRMLLDWKGLGKPPVFSGREEDFDAWVKKVENYVSGVIPNVRGALSSAMESQDTVTATAVALCVPDLEAETSTEIDGQLFIVLSALTDGESFDVVMSAGGDRGFQSWRKLHRRWNPYTAGRALRRGCGQRDAQGNVHTLAEDIRMSSLEALLLDHLEKHVQLNRARLISYGVLREEIKTYCECRGHTKQNGPSHPGGDDPMDIGAFGKGKCEQGKGKHGKGIGKGKQGQQGQK